MRTLNLQQAAQFLKLHPITVLQRARAGTLPAAKPGKRWVFIEEDLAAYLRSKYGGHGQALQGDKKETSECHSTSVKAHRTGGSASLTRDDEYSKVLGLATDQRRTNSTTG
jgi:excisionase family DNA binding protein